MVLLDITGGVNFWIINIYALNNAKEQYDFFCKMSDFVNDNTILLGDFNSVVHSSDHLSGNTDATSTLLQDIIISKGLEEIEGPHRNIFTYHHPSVASRKSRLNQIYVSFGHQSLRGYSTHFPGSDHYLVGVFQLPDDTMGPKPWHFPSDLLENESFCQQVALICENFDNTHSQSWETVKLKFQLMAQQYTCFRIKQARRETFFHL